jgi:1,4-dihydroxy-2-naphthoyl-CoA synthase
VVELTSATIAHHRASDEGQEGMRAFFEKRSPAWAAKPDA